MSSSQPFQPSSPVATGMRRRSKFTFKHLSTLSHSSNTCPLRVIAHVDLDAFYAQCELVRLGLPEDQPVAVQQWQGLIAINYPARAFGLTRMVTITEAKKLCPQLIAQHVATWREGDDKWAYRDDAYKHINTDKVSLDPYRLESRKILATIKETLPAPPLQKIEKAGIDEVFLDLSAQVHSILLERYPELRGPPPYDDPTENLPMPPSTVLDWQADALVDLDTDQTEEDDPDWDDIVMLIGSEIIRDLRKAIRDKLKYTCSAGIARNKFIAKLGSAHKKPNQQTIVRNRAIQHFLSGFKFTKIRNLGGKLGDHVAATFGTEQLVDLLQYSIDQLKSKLGDDTGSWLYNIIRGEDTSEVSSRTQIKSMLSAKSFQPSIKTVDQATKWLRIFVAEIYSRLVDEGVLENKRRPKTLNLHHRAGGVTRSKQVAIPSGKTVDEIVLFDLAKTLLGQVVVDGRAWPCAHLSLSIGGFEDGITGNRGIGSFLVRGEEAKALNVPTTSHSSEQPSITNPAKRRKTKPGPGESSIQNFFTKQDSLDEQYDEDSAAENHHLSDIRRTDHLPDTPSALSASEEPDQQAWLTDPDPDKSNHMEEDSSVTLSDPSHHPLPPLHQQSITSYFCTACQSTIPNTSRAEHEDWHFAKSLQDEEEQHQQHEQGTSRPSSHGPANNQASSGSGSGNGSGNGGSATNKSLSSTSSKKTTSGNGSASSSNTTIRNRKPEKGQKKLAFG